MRKMFRDPKIFFPYKRCIKFKIEKSIVTFMKVCILFLLALDHLCTG